MHGNPPPQQDMKIAPIMRIMLCHLHHYLRTEIAKNCGREHNIQGLKNRKNTEKFINVAETSSKQPLRPQVSENTPTREGVKGTMREHAQEIYVVNAQMLDISPKIDKLVQFATGFGTPRTSCK
jgi:hypothetical protein